MLMEDLKVCIDEHILNTFGYQNILNYCGFILVIEHSFMLPSIMEAFFLFK